MTELKEDGNINEQYEIARCTMENSNVNLLMTIPWINLYSATSIVTEIGDINRFEKREKFASYAGLTR